MAWNDLKAAVAAVIRTNGTQAITGALLQSTLNSIIDQVGANSTFKGVATPSTNPGTPDGPVFYLAPSEGTYSNFGGYVNDGTELILLNYVPGVGWSVSSIGASSNLINKVEGSFFQIKAQKGTSSYNNVVHIKKAISGIYLNGPVDENTYDYTLTVYSNNSSYRRLRVFKTNKSTLVASEICSLYVAQTTPYLIKETVNVPEYLSSGYSATVTLDWSKCQGVDYLSLEYGVWILTDKAFNLTQLNQSYSNKLLIDAISSILNPIPGQVNTLSSNIQALANNSIVTRMGSGYRWRQFVDTSTSSGSITDLQTNDVFIATNAGTILFVANVNPGDIILRTSTSFVKYTGDRSLNKENEYLEITSPSESVLIQLQAIKKAVISIWLDGPIDPDAKYCLAVYSNNSVYRRLRFFSVKNGVNTEICQLNTAQSSPRSIIETITIGPYNSSGFTVKVLVDWSKLQGVDYLSLFTSIWILSEKCFSEANFKYDIYNKNLIENTLVQSKKTENLIDGVDQLTLTNWILTNGTVQSQATGWSNYASFNKNLNEDKFSMSAKLKELSATYFETGIGKRASTSGTAITLRKDATGSYICFWGMSSSTSPTELTSFRQTLAKPLVPGDEYILKMTKDVNNMKVDLIYPDGDIVTYSTSTLNYYSWGYPSIYCITGQCQASEFSFSMPYSRNRDPKLLVFGDSFIEGNSIYGAKQLRYVSLLANDLGSEEVVIMGKGGESTTSVLNRFYQQVDWFSQAKYCLLALITNDSSFSTAKANILNMIAYLENYGIIPILVTCTYRGDSNNSVLQAAWNSWVRSSGYKYIDMSLAVSEPGDETIWRSGFQLPDLIHPSTTGHEYMYRRIKFDAQYLFKN